jgi:hypothetical protein
MESELIPRIRTAVGAGLTLAALTGCVNGFLFGAAPKEGIIRPSIKPFEPPVYAPVTGATPEPFKPDPPHLVVDQKSGQLLNGDTGKITSGTAQAHPIIAPDASSNQSLAVAGNASLQVQRAIDSDTGKQITVADKASGTQHPAVISLESGHLIDSVTGRDVLDAQGAPVVVTGKTVVDAATIGVQPLPASNPNAALTTVDGTRVQYIDAGNTLFLETSGLKPTAKYLANTSWPNGHTTSQPFQSDAGGNISGPQGKFIEFPHTGFYELQLPLDKPGIVTGDYRVDLVEADSKLVAQTVYFHVRPRPLIFATTKGVQERTVYFSDRPDEVYLHGEGLPPNALVTVYVIKADVNRFNPLVDGTSIADKTFENLSGLRYKADAMGMINQKVLTWSTRAAVDTSLVVIGKYLNSEANFRAAEDMAIVDHPTFVIKDGKAFFDALKAVGTPIYTPAPVASP